MRRACGSFRSWTCGGRATRSRPRWRGARRSSAHDGPTCAAASRGRTSPFAARDADAIATSRAAATCSPTSPASRRAAPSSSPPAPKCRSRSARASALAAEGIAVRVVSMPCTQRLRPRRTPRIARRAAARRAARRRRGRRHRRLAQVRRRRRRSARGASSASTASANRRPPACCSSTSASRSSTSPRRCGASSRRDSRGR